MGVFFVGIVASVVVGVAVTRINRWLDKLETERKNDEKANV